MSTKSLRVPVSIFKKIFYRAISVQALQNTEQNLKSWREIPGPARLPFIGQLHHFLPGGKFYGLNSEALGRELHKSYGNIVRLDGFMGRLPFVMLFDPESCAHILRSENWLPIRTGFETLDYYRKKHGDATKCTFDSNVKSTGLLTDKDMPRLWTFNLLYCVRECCEPHAGRHGDSWKQFRSTANPVLLQPKTIKLYKTMIDEVAQDMIKRLKSLRNSENHIESDFEMEMNPLVSRIHCSVHEVFKAADELDFKPSIWRYYPTKAFKKAMELYKEQEVLARYFIDKTIEDLDKSTNKKPDEEKSVLEKLLAINKEVALIMASDTSNTITATLYLLAHNQTKQDNLREEALSETDKRPYLKACIKESIRLLPIVAGNVRMTTKEYNLHGYKIPKGMQISFMHQTMSTMESQYLRAQEFIPERWLVKKDDPLYHGNAHPFAYQPFGFGVRSCIGRRIAELELELFLLRLMQNFKVEWQGPPIEVKSTSLNYIAGPFNFIFKDL
ncbi:hypothetical protein ACJJTC_011133 [Scirpophaga incertulas]